MNRIRMATVAALLASVMGFQAAPLIAAEQRRGDRYEDRWERQQERRERARREAERREDRREARYEARRDYWDAARYYRQDNRRYRAERMGRYDRVYRGSDNRYYCKRDDGTTGLIVGGISGAVLGTIIAPGESKVLGDDHRRRGRRTDRPGDRRRRRGLSLTPARQPSTTARR